MNNTLRNTAHIMLIEMLQQCTEPQQMIFKRMYSHKNLDATIEQAVLNMDESKIDWAISQVERTIENNAKKAQDAKDHNS